MYPDENRSIFLPLVLLLFFSRTRLRHHNILSNYKKPTNHRHTSYTPDGWEQQQQQQQQPDGHKKKEQCWVFSYFISLHIGDGADDGCRGGCGCVCGTGPGGAAAAAAAAAALLRWMRAVKDDPSFPSSTPAPHHHHHRLSHPTHFFPYLRAPVCAHCEYTALQEEGEEEDGKTYK